MGGDRPHRRPDATRPSTNFGWPCYEGAGRQPGYDAANLEPVREALHRRRGAVTRRTSPTATARRSSPARAARPAARRSRAGVPFYGGGTYPAAYDGALFFADYSRNCIWVMLRGQRRCPTRRRSQTFVAGARRPGRPADRARRRPLLRRPRRRHDPAHPLHGRQPAADGGRHGDADLGPAPLTVALRRHRLERSRRGRRAHLRVGPRRRRRVRRRRRPPRRRTRTRTAGTYTARLRVTDTPAPRRPTSVTITAGNTPPPRRSTRRRRPSPGRSGDAIAFSGHATDAEDGTLPASALTWSVILHHCPSNCHTHVIQDFAGVRSGSFSAPDHEYPSYLELRLTARTPAACRPRRASAWTPRPSR